MPRITACVLIIVLASSIIACAEDTYKLDKIVVTPSRLTTTLSENSRSLTILDKSDFESSAYKAIPDMIGEMSGVDIRRRGPEGVQADMNIRGTTFEQNTVLIDGIKVNDPQTGHFNMDLPLTMMDLDTVEVLKGPASSLYGANSFGGAINLITKKPSGEKIILYAEGGSYDYFDGGLSVSVPVGIAANRFSFEQSRSTGYMPQTEFNILALTNSTLVETGIGVYNFLFGYQNKDFGAANFYSNLYPNEYERTDTRFFKIDGETEIGNLRVEPKLFLRRHGDKFMLDQNRAGWQTNYSTTYNYGGELDFAIENAFSDASWGYELSRDTIDSTNLQTHSRTMNGFYMELAPHLAEDLYLNVGFREDYYGDFGWEASPSVSASYKVLKYFTLRGSAGRAYRIPTFTDLYYNDAANIGSSSLLSESSWSYEGGAEFNYGALSASCAYFHRDSYDTIDWIRYSSLNPWRATNIGTTNTNGFELSLGIMPDKVYKGTPLKRIYLTNTILDVYAKHDYLSKYALDYLKEQLCAGVDLEASGFKNSWILNYKKRIGDSGYIVADTKISKEIVRKGKVSFEAYIEVTNIFDVSYSEQSDISMPGRWINAGARLEF